MPTEAEIEAAARKICADLDGNPDDRAQGIEDGRIRWSWYADAARVALTAAEEVRGQAVPDGWVLVPKEPTDSMCLAGYTTPCASTYGCDTFGEIAKSNTLPLYLAMLAATPKPEDKR